MVLGLAEPLKSPCHSTNSHPSAGTAVVSTTESNSYPVSVSAPTSTSSKISPIPTVVVSSVKAAFSKWASSVLLPFIVRLNGFVVPVKSPLHSTNCHPSLAMASTSKEVSRINSPSDGSTVPASSGIDMVVRLNIRSNVTVTVLGSSMVISTGFSVLSRSPSHSINAQAESGTAVSSTMVPTG